MIFEKVLSILAGLSFIGVPHIKAAASEGAPSQTVFQKPKVEVRSEKKSSAAKGKRSREKEDEGTQAPQRFEADTVIKSKYELNGQSLEVDPD